MIKKKECLEFLDKVEYKAIQSVRDRFSKEIEAEKKELLDKTGFNKQLTEVQHDFNKFQNKYISLINSMNLNKTIGYSIGNYDSLEHFISCYIGKRLIEKIVHDCSFEGGSVQTLKDNLNKEINEVKAEYSKVRAVCEKKENGAKVAEYLKGLGFDISSLEEKENNKIVPQINKEFLFVCGERK